MQEIMLVKTKVRGMMYLQKNTFEMYSKYSVVLHLETKIPLTRPVMKQV